MSSICKPLNYRVSKYELTRSVAEQFKSSLPSIEEIEAELAGELGVGV